MALVECFTSAPIKLAALIHDRKRQARANNQAGSPVISSGCVSHKSTGPSKARPGLLKQQHLSSAQMLALAVTCYLLLLPPTTGSWSPSQQRAASLRHQAHYMKIIPSTHFQYSEGRQQATDDVMVVAESRASPDHSAPHIYKRSSALISAPVGFMGPPPSPRYAALVSSSHQAGPLSNSLMSRRMMSDAGQARLAWLSSESNSDDPANVELLATGASQIEATHSSELSEQPTSKLSAKVHQSSKQQARNSREDAELLRQKQHIQYHDQWPSISGKCHKRTLNFCASVLPFNTTTFPNIIGDTNRFEVKRSLPFFGFLAKSSCNKRLDELLCLLLEPPCNPSSGVAVPPCKKFCRLALEGCNEYIPATLAMSSVFDCRQYPDSNDPNVCINLAQGSKCAQDEFKCPDKTCIPRESSASLPS